MNFWQRKKHRKALMALFSCVLACALLLPNILLAAGSAEAATGSLGGQQYTSGLIGGSSPSSIALGPDSNLWFTDAGLPTPAIGTADSVSGRIYEYASGLNKDSNPYSMTLGPDSNLWFTDAGPTPAIGRVSVSGQVYEYTSGLAYDSIPNSITSGPDTDGNLWFTDAGSNPSIGKITTSGAITEYPVNGGSWPFGITSGPDNNLWFTDPLAGIIGSVNPATGVINEYTTGLNSGSLPVCITLGPDNNLWFTDAGATPAIGCVNPATGAINEYTTGLNSGSKPYGMTLGHDGNLWFTDAGATPAIGMVTATGAIAESTIDSSIHPIGITCDGSGNLWYSSSGQHPAIGEITVATVGSTPFLTVLTPSHGLPSGGYPVTIAGANLSTVTAVYFGNTKANVTALSNTSITAVAPAGSGTVAVAVYGDGGQSNSLPFTYTYGNLPSAPAITPHGDNYYTSPQTVSVSISASLSVGQAVYYTKDGNSPSLVGVAGSVYYSGSPFSLTLDANTTTTVIAAVYDTNNGQWSDHDTASFTEGFAADIKSLMVLDGDKQPVSGSLTHGSQYYLKWTASSNSSSSQPGLAILEVLDAHDQATFLNAATFQVPNSPDTEYTVLFQPATSGSYTIKGFFWNDWSTSVSWQSLANDLSTPVTVN